MWITYFWQNMINLRRTMISFGVACPTLFIISIFWMSSFQPSGLNKTNGISQQPLLKDYAQNHLETNHSNAKFHLRKKLLLLWTPYQRDFRNWKWTLGRGPVISKCKNQDVSGKCVITRNRKMTKHADVILFSIQDLKKVSF